MIQGQSQLRQIGQTQLPAVSQGWSRLERAIISGVIESSQLGGLLRSVVKREIISRAVVAVREQKLSVVVGFDRDLPDAAQSIRQPIPERAFRRESAHFKARAIRNAACSRKSRSFSVNAFSFSLSTLMNPTTLLVSVITGTTISDCVLPNVGK